MSPDVDVHSCWVEWDDLAAADEQSWTYYGAQPRQGCEKLIQAPTLG